MTPPDAGDAPELPADWPALWDELLRARAAVADAGTHRAEAAREHAGALRWRDGCGWQLAGAASAGSAALAALYLPLLDAATTATAPWWLAQLGQSLDGCIATASGDSAFVTGAHSLLHLHRLRALADAVLVGAGTVAADDPQLTTRRVPGRHAVRVVLDPGLRLDGRARIFVDGQAPTWWLCDARHRARAEAMLATAGAPAAAPPPSAGAPASGARVLTVDGLLRGDGSLDSGRAVAALVAAGLRLVFVEGGGVTVSRLLAAGCLQRLHLVVAPLLIGAGRRGLQGPTGATLAACLRPPARVLALGDDQLWDLDLAATGPGATGRRC